jgi:hypothetical protein
MSMNGMIAPLGICAVANHAPSGGNDGSGS